MLNSPAGQPSVGTIVIVGACVGFGDGDAVVAPPAGAYAVPAPLPPRGSKKIPPQPRSPEEDNSSEED